MNVSSNVKNDSVNRLCLSLDGGWLLVAATHIGWLGSDGTVGRFESYTPVCGVEQSGSSLGS